MTPWDTNISPPELVRVVEGDGPEHVPPGRALDLGCGTGTNALYLAAHGWDVVGIDFAAPAIAHARVKQRQAGTLAESVRFARGDVTHLEVLGIAGPFDLVFDLGCFHGIASHARSRYAAGITRLARPGGRFLLYAFEPTQVRGRLVGVTPDDVRAIFAAGWTVERIEVGRDTSPAASAWYWLRRTS
jgi:SAM-dependent methyltransferase